MQPISQVINSKLQQENTTISVKLRTIKEIIEAKYKKGTEEEQKKESLEEFETRLEGVLDKYTPPRFKDSTITHPAIGNFLSKEWDGSTGLYLFGGCGTGKTTNLYGIHRLLLANYLADKENNIEPNLINVVDFFSELKQTFDSPDSEEEIQKLIKTKDILLIDDFGVEKQSEWALEATYRLINYRYEWMLPTFFSSNLSLKELTEKIGDRFTSRIAQMCKVVKFEGKDKRVVAPPVL